ncbi:uncharacterized protein FOMMEDRAFT_20948 [Fomitiporia mediterranea MF3/22]|uniref:uncharacterized protein n=1 Tax=Fomitiporia mediterranea (strain MF3/22) TaxID=694068 RepID=UPI0004409559|nr:uncharacterized protein FOMMEDRAFT_20948 [Fomitiporia mediterranea MF3/22]EJD02170.1 hypothetical protein FOMMEDRAFT_20948 [Fomitiporia mediterranea MF3/22]
MLNFLGDLSKKTPAASSTLSFDSNLDLPLSRAYYVSEKDGYFNWLTFWNKIATSDRVYYSYNTPTGEIQTRWYRKLDDQLYNSWLNAIPWYISGLRVQAEKDRDAALKLRIASGEVTEASKATEETETARKSHRRDRSITPPTMSSILSAGMRVVKRFKRDSSEGRKSDPETSKKMDAPLSSGSGIAEKVKNLPILGRGKDNDGRKGTGPKSSPSQASLSTRPTLIPPSRPLSPAVTLSSAQTGKATSTLPAQPSRPQPQDTNPPVPESLPHRAGMLPQVPTLLPQHSIVVPPAGTASTPEATAPTDSTSTGNAPMTVHANAPIPIKKTGQSSRSSREAFTGGVFRTPKSSTSHSAVHYDYYSTWSAKDQWRLNHAKTPADRKDIEAEIKLRKAAETAYALEILRDEGVLRDIFLESNELRDYSTRAAHPLRDTLSNQIPLQLDKVTRARWIRALNNTSKLPIKNAPDIAVKLGKVFRCMEMDYETYDPLGDIAEEGEGEYSKVGEGDEGDAAMTDELEEGELPEDKYQSKKRSVKDGKKPMMS